MGLTTIKTYANKLLYTLGVLDAANTRKELIYLIKESMLYGTNGVKGSTEPGAWKVLGSSDSVAAGMDNTDRWIDRTKVVQAVGSHSWIVLQQVALGDSPGYLQVCIDLNSTLYLSIVFSSAASFTGGSISARPIATNEVVVANANLSLVDYQTYGSCGVNCLKSTDGKVTRIFPSVDGVLGTGYKTLWFMEQLNNVETHWPSNCVVGMSTPTLAGLVSNINTFTYQGSSHSGLFSMVGNTVGQIAGSNLVNVPDYGGAWSVFPFGFFISTGLNKGKLGDFYDLWAAPTTMPNYEYLAGSGGDFEFVNIGGIIQPWVGTALKMP